MSTFKYYGLSALELVAELELGLLGAVQVHQAVRVEHEVFRKAFLEGLRTIQEFCGATARKERLAHLHRNIFFIGDCFRHASLAAGSPSVLAMTIFSSGLALTKSLAESCGKLLEPSLSTFICTAVLDLEPVVQLENFKRRKIFMIYFAVGVR